MSSRQFVLQDSSSVSCDARHRSLKVKQVPFCSQFHTRK